MPGVQARIGVAGAGLSGAVLARRLAEEGGRRVVVFEGAPHVAGHCHTERDARTGVMVHVHGAHVFHTSRADVWAWVNRFATFRPYTTRFKAVTPRGVFSLPINLLTINQFFGKALSPREARAFLETLGDRGVGEPRSLEEQALRFVGRDLYEAFFRGYSKKQWGVDPADLPASVLKRLPVRFNYDDDYFDDAHQGIPEEGYTALVARMLAHPGIELRLGERLEPGARGFEHVFWSGPLDAYFGHRLGRLRYRTLDFERIEEEGDFQGNAVLTYTDERVPWNRITEHKHFAPWERHERTVAFKETARDAGAGDAPYYPLRLVGDRGPLRGYVDLARAEPGVTFVGRLGTYRYLDMHVVVGEALDLAARYLARHAGVGAFAADPL